MDGRHEHWKQIRFNDARLGEYRCLLRYVHGQLLLSGSPPAAPQPDGVGDAQGDRAVHRALRCPIRGDIGDPRLEHEGRPRPFARAAFEHGHHFSGESGVLRWKVGCRRQHLLAKAKLQADRAHLLAALFGPRPSQGRRHLRPTIWQVPLPYSGGRAPRPCRGHRLHSRGDRDGSPGCAPRSHCARYHRGGCLHIPLPEASSQRVSRLPSSSTR